MIRTQIGWHENTISDQSNYHNQVPPKVEYDLSEYGWSLQGVLDSLCAWGEFHITKVYGDKSTVPDQSVLNENL